MPILSPKITKCAARQIFDSRGMAALEVEVSAGETDVFTAIARVPVAENSGFRSGFATGDMDGGVHDAVENIGKIIVPKILKADVETEAIDRTMFRLDMTPHKTKLGASAVLGVSLAVARLESKIKKIPLWKLMSEKAGMPPGKPLLYMNIFSGGSRADFCLPFREYMAAVNAPTFAASYEKLQAIFENVREKLHTEGVEYYMGDEGGFAARFDTLEKPFEVLLEALAQEEKESVFLAINVAASELYRNGRYEILGKSLGRGELLLSYRSLVEKFTIKSLEDPFAGDDLSGFQEAMHWLKDSTLIAAHALIGTNPGLIQKYAEQGFMNAVVIVPGQIGTLTEIYDAVRTVRKYDCKIIVSQCLGETLDPLIADLAVGIGAYGIKAGVPAEPERAVKYERLVEIEKEMGAEQ